MTGAGNGFGVSFLPNGDQRYQRPQDQYGASAKAPVQEAIDIIRMRVPRVVGANPLAPLALLTGQGSAGLQPGQLEQLMRTLGMTPPVQATGSVANQPATITGAPSPFAQNLGVAPTSGLSGEGVIGGRYAPAGGSIYGTPQIVAGMAGNNLLQMPEQPAPTTAPTTGTPEAPQDDSAALWEIARRQRESMGRIAY